MKSPGERKPIQDVNIQLGDEVSDMLYEASRLTYDNRPGLLTEFHESFSGTRAINMAQFPDSENLVMNLGSDGVGTKVEIAERNKDYSTIAYDLFAMVCDDAVVRGAEAIALTSVLDVNHLNDTEETREAVRQLALGYVAAAREAGVVVVNGEVAELGDRIEGHGNFHFNWGATVLWIAHRDRLLTGHDIEPGQSLVGLAEHGFRSNGITAVREAMLDGYGDDWQHHIEPRIGDSPLGLLVARPSQIYSRFVSDLTGGYDINREPKAKITGVAHITGGGMPSKLSRMLEPSGLGAVIDTPFEPPLIMKEVQSILDLPDRKAYGKWHMGQGMVVATPEPETVIALATEAGIDAKRIGGVSNSPSGSIFIIGRGAERGGVMEFARKD